MLGLGLIGLFAVTQTGIALLAITRFDASFKQIADTKEALNRANIMSSTEETTDINPLRQSLEAELAKADVSDTELRAHVISLTSSRTFRPHIRRAHKSALDVFQATPLPTGSRYFPR